MVHWQLATKMICVEKINIWAHIYHQDARLLHNQCFRVVVILKSFFIASPESSGNVK